MTAYFRHHLGAKLLLSYFAIIVVGVLVLLVASQAILPATFNHHMSGMGMTLAPGASAGASLTPSPTIATCLPWACNFLTSSALSCGRTSARIRSIPIFVPRKENSKSPLDSLVPGIQLS